MQYGYDKICPVSWSMLVLQDCVDLLTAVPDSCSGTCLSPDDRNEFTSIKVEEVSYITEEEGLEPMKSAVIKAEPEVRCMSVLSVVHIP
jgi:hypothetical protein